jgi:hypothetical protein
MTSTIDLGLDLDAGTRCGPLTWLAKDAAALSLPKFAIGTMLTCWSHPSLSPERRRNLLNAAQRELAEAGKLRPANPGDLAEGHEEMARRAISELASGVATS